MFKKQEIMIESDSNRQAESTNIHCFDVTKERDYEDYYRALKAHPKLETTTETHLSNTDRNTSKLKTVRQTSKLIHEN